MSLHTILALFLLFYFANILGGGNVTFKFKMRY